MKRSILAIALLAASSAALAFVGDGVADLHLDGTYFNGSASGGGNYAQAGVRSSAATYSRTGINATGPNTTVLAVNGGLAVSGGIAGASSHAVQFCRYQGAGAHAGGLTGSLSVTGGYVNIEGDATTKQVAEAGAVTEVNAKALSGEWSLSGELLVINGEFNWTN